MYSSNGQNRKKEFFSTLRHKNNSRCAKDNISEPENDIMAPLILGIYIRHTLCVPSLLAQQ